MGRIFASPILIILVGDPNDTLTVRIFVQTNLDIYFLNQGRRPFTSIIEIQGGNEAIPLLIREIRTFMIFVINIILHERWEAVPGCHMDLILSALLVPEFTLFLMILQNFLMGEGRKWDRSCNPPILLE